MSVYYDQPVTVWPAAPVAREAVAVECGGAERQLPEGVSRADGDLSLNDGALQILHGDVRERLRGLDAESVHCVVTSPPYYAVRSYPGEGQLWGGDPACEHSWDEVLIPAANGIIHEGGMSGETLSGNSATRKPRKSNTCRSCGCWKGSLGLEPTVGQFIEHLVEVFREVKRVLRSDGVCWLNIGDSLSTSPAGKTAGDGDDGAYRRRRENQSAATGDDPQRAMRLTDSVPAKNLLLVPERLALALQDDGWIVRSRVTWVKRAPLPESCRDRPTKATETIWMLTKRPRYFYDQDAYRTPLAESTLPQVGQAYNGDGLKLYEESGVQNPSDVKRRIIAGLEKSGGANLRDAWILGPEPLALPHFAAYPTEIPRRAIMLSTSERGCCSKCGAQWVRQVERKSMVIARSNWGELAGNRKATSGTMLEPPDSRTVGFEPGCKCDVPPKPSTVLDPFCGSGTTLLVASQLGRRGIGVELSAEYVALAKERLAPELAQPRMDLFFDAALAADPQQPDRQEERR